MNTHTELFHARFQRVLEYIDDHLDDDLSVGVLCSVAAFSKYHFHRQFTQLFGIGAYRYVQLCRLKRASYLLAYRDHLPVLDIALASGYEGPESFSRAFKRSLGQSPSEFRQRPRWNSWHETHKPLIDLRNQHMNSTRNNEQVHIVSFPETRVAAIEHRGNPELIGNTIRRFITWRKQNKLSPKVSSTFNILYNHPEEVPAEEYRMDICVATNHDRTDCDVGIVDKTIPAGRCAVLRHVGSDEALDKSVRHLYAQWLPESGEEPRDFPVFLQRIRFFPDVPENEAITDVFLPVN